MLGQQAGRGRSCAVKPHGWYPSRAAAAAAPAEVVVGRYQFGERTAAAIRRNARADAARADEYIRMERS